MMQPSSRSDSAVTILSVAGRIAPRKSYACRAGSSADPNVDPDARSQLIGAECPWGADQSHAAKLIEQAGYKIEFNCDLVIFQMTFTARLVAGLADVR